MKVQWLWLAVLALGGAAFTGCGSDDAADDSPMTDSDSGSGGGSDAGGDPETDASAAPDSGTDGPDDDWTSTRGMCDLDSGFPGDETCLLPPPPGEGIQIRIGPPSYSEEDVQPWLMAPGAESSQCYFFKTPNTEEVWFQTWELSGRPGTHHIINSALVNQHAEGFSVCLDQGLGNSPAVAGLLPGASRAYMPRTRVAPENRQLGSSIPGETSAQADMHYFNFTGDQILREFWLNLYTVDRDQVSEQGQSIRGMGGLSWLVAPIQPGTHRTYSYECPVNADGRIIRLIGHTHKHGIRETAWIKRAGGDRVKVFEQYDYLEPQIFEYNSITENPDFSEGQPGAYSGMLEVSTGDVLQWECEVNNTSNVALSYSNEVETGEMCNIWGEAVGPMLNCLRP
jgi:hypothetical protein